MKYKRVPFCRKATKLRYRIRTFFKASLHQEQNLRAEAIFWDIAPCSVVDIDGHPRKQPFSYRRCGNIKSHINLSERCRRYISKPNSSKGNRLHLFKDLT